MLIKKKNLNFWKKKSNLLEWKIKQKKTFERKKNKSFKWYLGGRIDLYYNLILKNLKKNSNKTAIITLSKNHEIKEYSYKQIDKFVDNFSINLLSKKNIKRVIIHSSATLNSAISMLSCIKNGIFFSVIFKELPQEAIKTRINLFKPDLLITEDKKLFSKVKTKFKKKFIICSFSELNKKIYSNYEKN